MRTVRAAAALVVGAAALATGAPASAATGVDLGGEPIAASTNPAAPHPLGPGLWSTDLGPQTQPQVFTYDRRIQGSTIHVGVVGAPLTSDGDGLSIEGTVPAADDTTIECGSTYDTTDSVGHALVGADIVVGDEDSDECRDADVVTIRITRYSGSAVGDLPIAVKIVEEAPATDPGPELSETEELRYDVPTPVDPVTTAGGTSFDAAPLLDVSDGPVTVDTTITRGTELLWQVPLGWGDQLVAAAELAGAADDDPALGTTVELHVVQPDRAVFALADGADATSADHSTEAGRLVVASYPLRYANRYDDLPPSLPGHHWVALAADPADEGETAAEIPVRLTVAVSSTDVGGPTYQGAVLAQGADSGVEDYAPETPYLIGEGEFAADASGSPLAATSSDWWGPRRAVGIAVGVVGLLCCVTGGVWFTRRAAASR